MDKLDYPKTVSECISQGNALLQRNQLDAAEELFKYGVETFAVNPGVKERYAHVALRKQDFDAASTRYESLCKAHPENISGFIGLGDVLLRRNQLDSAEEMFKYCVEKFSDHPGAMERYARVALLKQNIEAASVRYKSLNTSHPEHVWTYIGLGNVLLRLNRLDAAEETFERCLGRFPDNEQALERHAQAAFRRQDLAEASARYHRLLQAFPENALGAVGLGNVLLQQYLVDEAEEVFGNFLKKFPDHVQAQERHALAAFRKMDFEAAYVRYCRLMQAYPEKVSGYIGVGDVLLQQSLFDEAEEFFVSCLEKFPSNSQVQDRLALAALRNLSFEKASARYEKLMHTHPDDVSGYIGLGSVMLQKNYFDAAEKIFMHCLELFPENTKALERYAFVALRRQRLDEAYARYERLRKVDPKKISSYVGQITVLIRNRKFCEAESFIKSYLKKFNYSPNAVGSAIGLLMGAIKENALTEQPSLAVLALRLYSIYVKYAFAGERCFDHGGYVYASLLGARKMCRPATSCPPQVPRRAGRGCCKTMAIFGDSHVVPTFYCPRQFELLGFKVNFFPVSGASIVGLGRNKSTLELLPKITQYIVSNNPDYVLMKFGQVDNEFGYYYKKFVKKERVMDVDSFAESLLEKYKEIICKLTNMTNVVVGCINLPSIYSRRHWAKRTLDVITGDIDEGQFASLHDKLLALQPSIVSRTKRAIQFNAKLEAMCREIGVLFVDHTEIFQDKTTGLLHLYNQSDDDHHYVTSDFMRSKVVEFTLEKISEAPGATPPEAARG